MAVSPPQKVEVETRMLPAHSSEKGRHRSEERELGRCAVHGCPGDAQTQGSARAGPSPQVQASVRQGTPALRCQLETVPFRVNVVVLPLPVST